jgi:hypothetical protein
VTVINILKTGVGAVWVKPIWSRSLQRYNASLLAIKVVKYSVSALDRAVVTVLCIF